MQPAAADRRDPALAALFSALVPGSGLLYAGDVRAAAAVLMAEAVLWALGWWLFLLVLHVYQITLAAGAAAIRGERRRDVFETRRRESAGQT